MALFVVFPKDDDKRLKATLRLSSFELQMTTYGGSRRKKAAARLTSLELQITTYNKGDVHLNFVGPWANSR